MKNDKKALIVGISDYGGKVPRLESPEREIEEWRDLLMENYGFSCGDIRMLANTRARKDEIKDRLKWLYKDAGPGDQRVFIYAGHGMRLARRNRDTGEIDNLDEALIAYPSSEHDDLEMMGIFDDELFDMYTNSGATDANVTWILDCCHGGGFNSRDIPRSPKVMSVSLPVDLQHRSVTRSYQRRSRAGHMPVILNAAGELNLSIELEIDGDPRSLFSYHAISVLRDNPKITYDDLVDKIREPIDQQFPQHVNARGNEARRRQPFLN